MDPIAKLSDLVDSLKFNTMTIMPTLTGGPRKSLL